MQRRRALLKIASMPGAVAMASPIVSVHAQAKLPSEMSWTAYDAGSSGFNIAVAIRLFKEAGIWSEAAQKHNDGLGRRQQVLADAWKAFGPKGPSDEKEFAAAWLKARAEGLAKAGMEVVFD